MQAIILAGGKATRLPESAKDLPKALVQVGGKPILEHQINLLQTHGFFDIRLALGDKAQQIIHWLKAKKANVDFVIEPEQLDTGGAIKFAARGIQEPFLVLNGDILSDINLKNFYDRFSRFVPLRKGSGEAMTKSGVARKKNPIENLIAVTHVPDARSFGVIKKRGERVLEFLEKPVIPVPGYINAGFYILSPHIFKNIEEKKFSIEKSVFPNLAASGKLGYYIHRGFWTDAGTEERLREVKKIFT